MKNTKLLISLLFICMGLFITRSYAGVPTTYDPAKWAFKYQYYRWRFSRYFITVGPNAGESLPIASRSSSGGGQSKVLNYDDQPDYMGFYLGMLATEYRLRKDAGEDVSEDIKELYYALYAINRLDLTDPTSSIGNTTLDGFFIREDVPPDFIINHPQLNEGLTTPYGNYMTLPSDHQLIKVDNVDAFSTYKGASNCSCWYGYNGCPSHQDAAARGSDCYAMSMDHDVRVLMGLALIKRYVDSGVQYNGQPFQDNETNIKHEAINIAGRIINYMKNGAWFLWMPNTFNGNPPTATVLDCILTDSRGFDPFSEPCTGCQANNPNLWSNNNPALDLVPRGCFPGEYAFGIKKAGKWITGNTYSIPPVYALASNSILSLTPAWLTGIPTYCNVNFFSGMHCLWEAAKLPYLSNLIYSQNGNLSQVLTLAAIGNSWGDDLHHTQYYMNRLDMANQHWTFYTLLYSALHNKTSIFSYNDPLISQIMNSAPCIGPNSQDNYWQANNLFSSNTNGTVYQNTGTSIDTYNGLDYMLYYNLWYLNFKSNISAAYNTNWLAFNYPQQGENEIANFDITLTQGNKDFPYIQTGPFLPWHLIGGNAHHLEVRAINTINASNHLNANANVDYVAGNTINLLPGFTTKNNVTFNAYIEPAAACSGPGWGGNYERTDVQVFPMSTNTGNDDKADENLSLLTSSKKDSNGNRLSNQGTIQIYPNPSHQTFTIVSTKGFNGMPQVTNLVGQHITVESKKISPNELQLDMSGYPKGIYILKIGNVVKKLELE